MILLSNAGSTTFVSKAASDQLVVGTVDGVAVLRRERSAWKVVRKCLEGCNVSAVTQTPGGTLFAATHGVGVARSLDDGLTWKWCNRGIEDFDLWAAKGGQLNGRDTVCVGSLPANVYLSEDEGENWRVLPALREVQSTPEWSFPPPPHVGHIKEIVIDGDRLLVGIEIGGFLLSTDYGRSFSEFAVEPEPIERDIHRILVHPDRPGRFIVANGIVGVMSSTDHGATWWRNPMPKTGNYPDAFVLNPSDPDELFLAAGDGWPVQWYERGRARGRIYRSRDAGLTWERLLGGLPDGQRALFGALSIETCPEGCNLFAADSDGQVFESRDGGEHWTIIADVPPVSKGEFHRALVKDRRMLANVDDVQASPAALARLAAARMD